MGENYNYGFIVQRIIETSQDKLNNWELEFINSIYEDYILIDRKLTEKQQEVVLKINRKLIERNG